MTLPRIGSRCANGLIALLLVLVSVAAPASEQDERRVTVGLRLFPAFLAADQQILQKSANDRLNLILLYRDEPAAAEELAMQLQRTPEIRGIPIHIEVLRYDALSDVELPVAGVFIAQPLQQDLTHALRFGVDNQVLVFSPFAGDVERGITGGIHISDRILPYINLQSLKASGLKLKEFFLEIAKRHE